MTRRNGAFVDVDALRCKRVWRLPGATSTRPRRTYAVLGLLDLDLAQAVQALEGGCEMFRHMLDHHDARTVGRQPLQHRPQGFGPPVEAPMQMTRSVVRAIGP